MKKLKMAYDSKEWILILIDLRTEKNAGRKTGEPE